MRERTFVADGLVDHPPRRAIDETMRVPDWPLKEGLNKELRVDIQH